MPPSPPGSLARCFASRTAQRPPCPTPAPEHLLTVRILAFPCRAGRAPALWLPPVRPYGRAHSHGHVGPRLWCRSRYRRSRSIGPGPRPGRSEDRCLGNGGLRRAWESNALRHCPAFTLAALSCSGHGWERGPSGVLQLGSPVRAGRLHIEFRGILDKACIWWQNWYISTRIRPEERIHNDLHTPPIEDSVVHHKHEISISTCFLYNSVPAQTRSIRHLNCVSRIERGLAECQIPLRRRIYRSAPAPAPIAR